MINNAHRASIVLLFGASGAGKSASVRVKLAKLAPPRLLIFDPGQDFGGLGVVTDSLAAVADGVLSAGRGGFRFVFRPARSSDMARERGQFDRLCRLAYMAGDVCLVADELEDVMSASAAPAWWRQLVRDGRKRGCRVIGMTQDPAGIEKRAWRLATVIRSGVLNDEEGGGSVARVARFLMVSPQEITTLPELHWIERDRRAGVIRRGRIAWRAGKPAEVVESEKS